MKPLNGYIICIRDNKIRGKGDILVGEKAYAVNPIAKVVNMVDVIHPEIKVGSTVHLPHHETMTIENDDLTFVKVDKIIGVLNQKTGKYIPVNRNVLIRKCVNDHIRDEKGLIALYMTDNHIEYTQWCSIVSVASDCQWIGKEHKGYFCQAPEESESLQRVLYSKDYMLKESEIEFITDGG